MEAVGHHPNNSIPSRQFVVDVICKFSPGLLSAERRIGPGCIQRPPEAQYQDEFYRCCHISSNGSLVTFPESGTAKGWADFYIPAEEPGVDLLRDGNQLENHFGRFSKTESYRTALPLSDYIILGCRTTHPEEPHSPQICRNCTMLFSRTISKNVCILDNMLRPVSGEGPSCWHHHSCILCTSQQDAFNSFRDQTVVAYKLLCSLFIHSMHHFNYSRTTTVRQ